MEDKYYEKHNEIYLLERNLSFQDMEYLESFRFHDEYNPSKCRSDSKHLVNSVSKDLMYQVQKQKISELCEPNFGNSIRRALFIMRVSTSLNDLIKIKWLGKRLRQSDSITE